MEKVEVPLMFRKMNVRESGSLCRIRYGERDHARCVQREDAKLQGMLEGKLRLETSVNQ